MRTIEFNDKDIKECKLALVNQNLTSLQSAFLMQYIANLEQALNEIRDLISNTKWNWKLIEHILQIIDKYTKEDN